MNYEKTSKEETKGEKSYPRYIEIGGIINETDYLSAIKRAEQLIDELNNANDDEKVDSLRTRSESEELRANSILTGQAKAMADFAGIELSEPVTKDSRVILYSVLRSDIKPQSDEGSEIKPVEGKSQYMNGEDAVNLDAKRNYHHSQMCDQQIFVEALRMVQDGDSVEKMKASCPNINFIYKR